MNKIIQVEYFMLTEEKLYHFTKVLFCAYHLYMYMNYIDVITALRASCDVDTYQFRPHQELRYTANSNVALMT